MVNFPSCSHHAIRKKVRPLKNFNLVGIHRSRFKFRALGLVLIISPLSELGITHRFFFMDSLFFKEHSVKISIFFSTSSTGSQSFSLGIIHWSRFEFGALGLVLIISLSSELGIAHHFFLWTPYSSRNILSKFQFFFLNQLNWFPKFQFRQNSLKHVRIRSTWACFDHISLIQPQNRAPFFLWTLCSSRNILSKFQNFSQPARPVGIQFNWFIKSACMEHWFWWFWSPIPTWLGPMGSRSVLGCILDPFWALFRIPCNPPWIHMDPWWESKLKA